MKFNSRSLCLLITALFLLFAQGAYGEDQAELERDLAVKSTQLKQLQSKIAKEKKRKATQEKEEALLKTQINKINGKIKLLSKNINYLAIQGRKLEINIADMEKDIAAKDANIGRLSGILRYKLYYLYRTRESDLVSALLYSNDIGDAIELKRHLKIFAAYDANFLVRIQKDKQYLEKKVAELSSKKITLSKKKKEGELLKEQRTGEIYKKQDLLGRVRDKKQMYEANIKALEADSNKISGIINRLEKKKSSLRGDYESEKKEMARKAGRYTWPANGEISSQFGWQVHPKYGVKYFNKGIKISAASNRDVYAIAKGRVEFAEWYSSYGNMVLIDHGGGIYSVYANMNRIDVEPEDIIPEGGIIGKTGATGMTEVEGLYFEIRVDGKPVDPLEWILKK